MISVPKFLNGHVCYCVVKRSYAGRVIFRDRNDFRYYFRLLKKYKASFGVRVFAFCILPRSVYVLAQVKDKKDLAGFIKILKDSYARYFKTKYKDDRNIRFRASRFVPIRNGRELLNGIKSIEFRPVRAEECENPIYYPWSSCSYRVLKNSFLDR